MKRQLKSVFFLIAAVFIISGCGFLKDANDTVAENYSESVTAINNLQHIDYFRTGALEHILEGELNRRGQAVGFHYDRLPTKKGEIIKGTETEHNEFGVYEAKIIVNDIEKKSNNGMSTFFPDEWDTQDVVDAINEAYEEKVYISGNTFEGLTEEGIVIRMYLDNDEKIISAFPIY